jgi:hypothetical protein
VRDDEYAAGIPAMTRRSREAVRRLAKRLREDRGDNHDALVDKRLEEREFMTKDDMIKVEDGRFIDLVEER